MSNRSCDTRVKAWIESRVPSSSVPASIVVPCDRPGGCGAKAGEACLPLVRCPLCSRVAHRDSCDVAAMRDRERDPTRYDVSYVAPPLPDEMAEIDARANGFADYHTERASFGGFSREFHARAETFLRSDIPRLLAGIRSQAATLRERDEEIVKLREARENAARIASEWHDVAHAATAERDDATATVRHLRDREASIIEACERVSDGGQCRADIVSAIGRIRRERDEARRELADFRAVARGKS